MANCPKEQYWDSLTKTCISCVSCSQRSQRSCTDLCKFLSCRREHGKYYDHLLGVCISCNSTCTQHPLQCAHFCEKKARSQMNLQPELRRPLAGEVEARLGNSGRHQGAEHGGLQTGSGPTTEACSEVALPPQPVETCSFCFPERRSPTQESTRTLGTLGLAGTAAPQPCARASVGVVRVPIGDAGPGA
ncbi:hypothetical protein ACRRTK_006853 [Alexandromys fortis]